MTIVDRVYRYCAEYFAQSECERMYLQLMHLDDEVISLSDEVNDLIFNCLEFKRTYINKRALECLKYAPQGVI